MFTNEYDEIVEYYLEVARNNVLDTSVVHKFGFAEDIDTGDEIVDIWRARPGGVFRIFNTMTLQTTGSSGDQRPYGVPLPIQPGTRLVYKARVYSNSTAISAGFHGILIKE